MVVGADRCKAGWFAVAIEDEQWSVDIHITTAQLWYAYRDADLILMDTPIGLRDAGSLERLCDLAARRVLGPRQSSVFPAPCRQALTAASYEEASRWNEQITGRRLSKQSFAIMSVIREVDGFLASEPNSLQNIREMHPEVCFWGLANQTPMNNYKKDDTGFSERLGILNQLFPQSSDIIQHTLPRFRSSVVSRDDIVDALVGAITACVGTSKLMTLPDIPECDSRGLRMEMVYRA